MSELIDRVEEALLSPLHYGWLRDPEAVARFDPRNIEATRNNLRAAARAAVEAMREPTTAMVQAGFHIAHDLAMEEDLSAAWRDMIDAALAVA